MPLTPNASTLADLAGSTPTADLDKDANNKSLIRAAIGLGQVDDTSDADKPISTATQTVLDVKAPAIVVTAAPYNVVMDSIADQSAAMQSALDDAAASDITRTVIIPPGTVFCNITLPKGVILRGTGGVSLDASITTTNTILKPYDPAAPCISIPILGGNQIWDMDITGPGVATSTSCAISVANGLNFPTHGGAAMPGMGLHVQGVRIEGFDDGYYSYMAVSQTFVNVTIAYCNYGWRCPYLADSWNLINCHGDYCNTATISVNSPRGGMVSGGEWGNQSCPLLIADGGGIFNWEHSNIESVGGTHLFETTNTNLVLTGNRVHAQSGSPTATIVRQTTYAAKVTFNGNTFAGYTNGEETGQARIWECDDVAAPWPDVISGTGCMRIATDNTYSATRILETADSLRFNPLTDSVLLDDFFGGTTTSGSVGETGWSWYNWSGTSAGSRPSAWGNGPGLFTITTGASSGNCFQLNHGAGVGNTMSNIKAYLTPWRMTFRFKLGSIASEIFHVGIVGGTVTSCVPADFIGIKFNPAESSKFVAYGRNASSNTSTTELVTAGTSEFYTARIKCLAPETVRVSIDNGPEVVLSSGLPNNEQNVGFILGTNESVAKSLTVDLVKIIFRSGLR